MIKFSHGKKWKTRRHLIDPTFHFEILNDFLLVINEKAEIMGQKLEALSEIKDVIDINRNISLCTLDIICGRIGLSLLFFLIFYIFLKKRRQITPNDEILLKLTGLFLRHMTFIDLTRQ